MPGLRSLSRNHDFTVLWVGTTISQLGSSVSALAFPLLGFALTHSAIVTSVVGSLEMAGNLVALLPAGILADRVDRHRIMRWSALLGAVLYAAVVAADLGGALAIWELYVAAFLTGVAAGLFLPAETAAVRAVVAPADLPGALSQNQSRQWIASLLGSPLGGALYGVLRWLPFAADAVSYAVNWLALGTLRTDLAPPPRPASATKAWRDIVDGWRYIFGDPFLRILGVWSPLANLSINAVFYVATLRLIQAGFPGWQIGLSESIVGVLGILGAVMAPALIDRIRTGTLMVIVSWAFVPLMVLIALWNDPWVLAGSAGAGVFVNPAGNAGISAYAQRIVPDGMLGRYSSTMSFTSMSLHPFAPLLAGGALALLGGRPAVFAIMGLCALVAMIPTLSRAIWAIPRPAQWVVPEAVAAV